MRTRISTTVDQERLTTARAQTGLADSELIDLALAALLEQSEREAEDRVLGERPLDLYSDLASELDNLPTGWPTPSPSLDPYDGEVPVDVLAMFTSRRVQ